MKKRTSNVSRRIVSLLMSLVLTLTLVTPAAFATEVVGGSGTAIIEGNANPADPAPGEDSENNEDKNTEDGKDEQPTNPGDEDKNPGEGEGDDANKPDEDKKDEAPDGENKDEENKDEQPAEDENNGEDDISLLNDENGTDVWDGTAVDTSWYAGHENETKFSIGTAAELAGLAALVNDGNDFSTKTVTLTNNIDLNNKAWTPIGNSDSVFAGTFDGNGHTISGLYINITGSYSSAKKGILYQGLFGCVEDGTVSIDRSTRDHSQRDCRLFLTDTGFAERKCGIDKSGKGKAAGDHDGHGGRQWGLLFGAHLLHLLSRCSTRHAVSWHGSCKCQWAGLFGGAGKYRQVGGYFNIRFQQLFKGHRIRECTSMAFSRH